MIHEAIRGRNDNTLNNIYIMCEVKYLASRVFLNMGHTSYRFLLAKYLERSLNQD